MDTERFDTLARGLATGLSRRRALGLLMGGLAATIGRGATAKEGKVGICHQTGAGDWNYITVAQSATSSHLAHGDVLTNLADVDNCGACGNACAAPDNATAYCSEGGCGFSCDEGYDLNDAGDACVAPDVCTGVPMSDNPAKWLTFAAAGGDYCSVIVNLTGYAGCATYPAEWYRRFRGNPENMADVSLGPTASDGSLVQSVGSYAKGGELDVRIDGVASWWTAVDC